MYKIYRHTSSIDDVFHKIVHHSSNSRGMHRFQNVSRNSRGKNGRIIDLYLNFQPFSCLLHVSATVGMSSYKEITYFHHNCTLSFTWFCMVSCPLLFNYQVLPCVYRADKNQNCRQRHGKMPYHDVLWSST